MRSWTAAPFSAPPPPRSLFPGCATTGARAGAAHRLPAAGRCRRPSGSSAPSPASGPIAPPASSSAPRRSATSAWSTITAMAAPASPCPGARRSSPPLLGLQGHQGPVAVIGAGRDGPHHRAAGAGGGLSGHHLRQGAAARHHLQHRRRPVAARSAIIATDAVTPEWRAQFAAALDYSWRRFQIMVGDDYGIRWLPTYVESGGGPEPPLLADLPAGRRVLARRTSIPSRSSASSASTRMYVETGRFLRQLTRDVQIAGRRDPRPRLRHARRHRGPARTARLQLHRPRRRRPVRRHGASSRCAASSPSCCRSREVRYAFTGEAGYMFPRADGILLGGTFERGDLGRRRRARRRSPASSPRTSACSPASAAPLELGRPRLQSSGR